MGVISFVDEVMQVCDVCRVSDKAPQSSIAGISTAPPSNEKLRAGLPFPNDATALIATDLYPGYPSLGTSPLHEPFGGVVASCSARSAISGRPKCIQLDKFGKWGDEIRTLVCAGRRIRLQFQGVGTHSRLLERHTGRARGIYNRLAAADRFPIKQIPLGVQYCLGRTIVFAWAPGISDGPPM